MRRAMRHALLGALILLQAGCTAIPRPQEAMQPVISQPESEPGGSTAPPEAVQPRLRWHLPTQGRPHRLWWGGELLLVAGMEPAANAGEDRFLEAVDTSGGLRWRRELAPSWLIDAAVDNQGVAHLLVTEGAGRGRLLSLGQAGGERLDLPWQEGWPRSLAVGEGGRCLVVGFDGQNGAFAGRLRVLAASGSPLFPDHQDRLTGFVGIPSADCSTVLMGYEGGDTGLYPSDLYRGSGLRLLNGAGQELWSLLNYHRPLALSADGRTVVALGVPSLDRAYQPPPWDTEPAPPYGQLLWLGTGGQILDRFRLPFPARVDSFQMTGDGEESLLLLASHQFTGADQPEVFRRLVWLNRRMGRLQPMWERLFRTERFIDLHLAADGSAVLLAWRTERGEDWLSLVDRGGRTLWEYRHGASVVAARLSADGRQAALLAEDGLWFFDTREETAYGADRP